MKKTIKLTVKILIGIILSAGLMYLTFRKTDLNALSKILKKSNLTLILAGALVHMGSYFIMGFRTRQLLGKGLSWLKLSITIMTGYIFNLVFFRLGDALRCYLVKDDYKASHAFATLVVEKLNDTFIVLMLAIVPVFSLSVIPTYIKKLLIIPFALFTLILVVLIISIKFEKMQKAIIKGLSKLPFNRSLINFYQGFNVKVKSFFERPLVFAAALIISCVLWAVYLIFFTLTVRGVGLNVSISKMCFILGVTTIGMNIPVSVGFIGTFHYSFFLSSVAVGIDKNIAIAGGLILHLSKVLGHAFMGGIGLMIQKFPDSKGVSGILKQIKNYKKNKSTPSEPQ